MQPTVVLPSRDLCHIIRYFWWMEVPSYREPAQFRFISDAYPELLFHSGKVPVSTFGDSNQEFSYDSCITGIIRRFAQLKVDGAVRMFFVKMQPWSLKVLFDVDAHHFVDGQRSLMDFAPRGWSLIQDMVLGGRNLFAIIRRAESLIRKRFCNWQPDPALKYAIQSILQGGGQLKVAQLNGQALVGVRRLEQLFKKEIGISPKNFSRIIRIRKVCEDLVTRKTLSLTQLGLDHGFYDQSHFIREFQYFTQMSPRKFAQSLSDKNSLYDLEI